MVRQIGNVLVFGLVAILLSSCAAGVKTIQTYKIEKKREPLAIEDPEPLNLQDIDWVIITKDNADEVFEKIKAGSKGGPAGVWSARKAQMLAKQYKENGGGYTS